jgi:uncharacterized protein (DUF58 family)
VTGLPPEPGDGDGGLPAAGPARMDELVRRLRWPVLRRLAVHPGGDERSRLRGPGMEYSEVREYHPGDDPRWIDWNLTARSDRTYVRESLPDRGLDVWLVMDCSRSLDWGTARCLKRSLAVELAAAAAHLLVRHGNRVGALVVDRGVHRVVPPAAGRTAVLRLLAYVDLATAAAASEGSTDLGRSLLEAGRIIRRRSLVLVVSDFLCEPGWETPLWMLGLRHEVVAARVIDPRELEIPDVGMVTFEDPETGRQLAVDTSSRRLRERFRAAAEEQRTQLRAQIERCGAAPVEISTGEELLPQLVRFLQQRRLDGSARARGRPA